MPSLPHKHRTATMGAQAIHHQEAQRETAARYDGAWRRLRRAYLDQFPLCFACAEEGRLQEATVVDHIQPIEVAPWRRLDASNLRSCCASHHAQITQRWKNEGINELPPEP